jgi:uncharacterized protein YjeT (DUF2065 family)
LKTRAKVFPKEPEFAVHRLLRVVGDVYLVVGKVEGEVDVAAEEKLQQARGVGDGLGNELVEVVDITGLVEKDSGFRSNSIFVEVAQAAEMPDAALRIRGLAANVGGIE